MNREWSVNTASQKANPKTDICKHVKLIDICKHVKKYHYMHAPARTLKGRIHTDRF